MRASNAPDSKWMFFDYDPLTMKTTYIQFEGKKIHFRETIPQWLAEQMIEENKARAKEFGDWSKHKKGAVIASIPDHVDQELKRLSGFDPTKGGWYDKTKYNSFLDDSDYAHLRTGGGKIGRKKKEAIWSPKTIAKVVTP